MSNSSKKDLVIKIFSELAAGNHRALLTRVAENSRWEITGTSPVSGIFPSRKDFYEKVLSQITKKLVNRVKPTVLRVIQEDSWVVVEWKGESTSLKGAPYDNRYCWLLRIENEEIQEGIIYSDTELVTSLLTA